MRSKFAFAALGLAALLLLASPAQAQSPSNVCVAAKSPIDAVYASLGYSVFPTVQEAVNQAVVRSNAVYQHYAVFVDWNLGAPWMESVHIYADADITVRGVTGPLTGQKEPPQSIVIASPDPMLPAMETTPALDSAAPVNNLLVEGLTLSNGAAGFYARSGAMPTLNRVYIIENIGPGVSCESGAEVLLVNCSIVQNGGDGVEVGADCFAKIIFCTIYQNAQSGVFVNSALSGSPDAEVDNSIVYQNGWAGLEWATASSPTLNSNDVFDNGTSSADDYINVTAGPNSLSIDPKLWLDSPPWIGALETSQCIYGIYTAYSVYSDLHSPVIDMADPGIVILPFTAEDFYGDFRPIAFFDPAMPLPDMGADEVSCGLQDVPIPIWYRCDISPTPVGRLDAGDLTVEVELSFAGDDEPILYMVPQGSNNNPIVDDGNRIRFTLSGSDGLGWYEFVSQDPVPRTTSLLSDGHAIVYLTFTDNYTFGYTDTVLIQDQAIAGRHTIIDTTPPQMAVPVGGFDASALIAVLNAQPELTASGGLATGIGLGTHPAGLGGFPGGWLPAIDPSPIWAPATFPNTDLDGLITPYVHDGLGTQIFVNAGSISNNIGPDNLNMVVTVPFEDLPPPLDPLDPAGPRADVVVAGFQETGQQTTANTPSNSIAEWSLSPASSYFTAATTEALCQYTTSGANLGFNPINPGGPDDQSYDYQNSQTVGEWSFTYNGTPGLDPLGPTAAPHVIIRFRAIDRAGNKTEVNQTVEPLHIWWFNDIHSRIVPNVENDVVAEARFSVQLTRTQNPVVTPEVQPLYTYRFYTSPDYDGPYTAFTPWANWTTWTPASTIFEPGTFGGQWVLLVTLAADEAGNVEQWPPAIATPDDPQVFGAGAGVGWMRFKIDQSGLDTAISPNFWHDWFNKGIVGTYDNNASPTPEANFGAQTIIPSPPVVIPVTDINAASVAGAFSLTAQAAVSNRAVQWFLYEGGSTTAVDSGVVNPTVGNTAVIPDGSYRLEDYSSPLQARRARNWVFTAATFIYTDANTNGSFDVGETVEAVDPTPASFAFTVVPQTSIDAYVRNRESMDRQPIKVQEER